MSRLPKPQSPLGRNLPGFPAPAPADYSDEVSEKDRKALKVLVKESEKGKDRDEWELVDGPGW